MHAHAAVCMVRQERLDVMYHMPVVVYPRADTHDLHRPGGVFDPHPHPSVLCRGVSGTMTASPPASSASISLWACMDMDIGALVIVPAGSTSTCTSAPAPAICSYEGPSLHQTLGPPHVAHHLALLRVLP